MAKRRIIKKWDSKKYKSQVEKARKSKEYVLMKEHEAIGFRSLKDSEIRTQHMDRLLRSVNMKTEMQWKKEKLQQAMGWAIINGMSLAQFEKVFSKRVVGGYYSKGKHSPKTSLRKYLKENWGRTKKAVKERIG